MPFPWKSVTEYILLTFALEKLMKFVLWNQVMNSSTVMKLNGKGCAYGAIIIYRSRGLHGKSTPAGLTTSHYAPDLGGS